MNLSIEYEKRKEYIDRLVSEYAGEFSSPSKRLVESVGYSAGTGGKRLRAILALEFFLHFGGKVSDSFEAFLAAVELLHLYTLVHDDLPCMDNDDFRRGKLTNHKVFGEDMALLCGDSLLNYAYELLFHSCLQARNAEGGKEGYIKACTEFAKRAGGRGIIGGQALEFEHDRVLDKEHVLEIYKHKTCDLIIAAIEFAATVANASEEEIEVVREFGMHFGIAFQIRDDILDKDKSGGQEKNSLLSLIGMKNANIILEEEIRRAMESLKRLEMTKGVVAELTDFIAQSV